MSEMLRLLRPGSESSHAVAGELREADDAHEGRSATEAHPSPLGRLSAEDRELAEAVRRGDTRVAGQLHDRLIGVIDQAVVRVLGERTSDHDDILQSCFEQVVRSLVHGNFVGNCSLATWAGRISSHVALNFLRARIRERTVLERDARMADAPLDFDEQRRVRARLELVEVRAELIRMNQRRAEVLVLHDLHGYQLSEIAGLLEITVSATQSLLVRGRKELIARMDSRRRKSARRSS